MKNFLRKHFLTWRLFPIVAIVVGIKLLLINFDAPLFELNSYFSTLVAANVFLLGFLISGVLPDYKEAEKLPADLSASLDCIIEECRVLYREKGVQEARIIIEHTETVATAFVQWFHESIRTRDVMMMLSQYAELFAALEPHTQANFLTRLKQEVASLRRAILRIRNIREIPFAAPAYAVAELFTTIVIFSVLFVDIGNVTESVFITGAITYLLIYMIALIRDLDNPFHFRDNAHLADEIAIRPLIRSISRNAKAALEEQPPRPRKENAKKK